MDTGRLADGSLIAFDQWIALPRGQRPAVWCPGRLADGTWCTAVLSPRAETSTLVSPHFWTGRRPHSTGCPFDDTRPQVPVTKSGVVRAVPPRDRTVWDLTDEGPARSVTSSTVAKAGRPAAAGGGSRTQGTLVTAGGSRPHKTDLAKALNRLLGGGFADGTKIRWQGRERPAAELFTPASDVRWFAGDRAVWGEIESAAAWAATGSWLVRAVGAPRGRFKIVVPAAALRTLGLTQTDPTQVAGRPFLALAACRRPDDPYLLVDAEDPHMVILDRAGGRAMHSRVAPPARVARPGAAGPALAGTDDMQRAAEGLRVAMRRLRTRGSRRRR